MNASTRMTKIIESEKLSLIFLPSANTPGEFQWDHSAKIQL